VFSADCHFQSKAPSDPIVRASTLDVLIQQSLFNSTRRTASIQLQSIKDTLSVAGVSDSVIKAIPNDPRTIQKWYNIDPVLSTYLSCPRCFHLHNLDPGIRNCSKCMAELWKTTVIGGKTITVPIRKYEHQKMEHWLGRLLSRKGVEEIIDNYRPNYAEKPWNSSDWVLDDIMNSIIVHKLLDEDGSRFFDSPQGEGRYIFAFAADGFNPFHLKEAHQTASSTGLWMVLLNFPPHLRYLPENVYLVGVIPGPRVPSVVRGQMTSTLKLVVDDLVKFRAGVKFSRTYKYRLGRLCKTACVVIVADALALRELTGFPSPNSQYPCTMCLLTLQHLQNLERETWPRRNLTDHILKATKWKNAENDVEQDKLFHTHYVRWSEFNRLDYFNIVLQSPADSFHTLYLNAVQHHCRAVWGIDLNKAGGDGRQYVNMDTDESSDSQTESDSSAQFKSRRKDGLMEDIIPHVVTSCRSTFEDVSINAQQYLYDWHHTPVQTPLPTASAGPPLPSQTDRQPRRDKYSSLDSFHPNITDKRNYLKLIKAAYQYTYFPGTITKKEVEDSANVLTLRLLLKDCGLSGYEQQLKKAEYVDLLLTWVLFQTSLCLSRSLTTSLTTGYRQSSRNSGRVRETVILGLDVMSEIYKDMGRTLLPSWISPAPNDWGTPRRGKLSSDEWRVIAVVHLPVTLIRIWGVDAGSRKLEMLENYMYMVSAIRLASMRAFQFAHITRYNAAVKNYLSSLQRLYGSDTLSMMKPHHHAMMHMGESMFFFGPNHARNTSWSERYIYLMQGQNMNNKFGTLEGTMMRSCSRMGNLHALLNEDPESQKIMARTLEGLDRLYREDNRGTRTANLIDPNNVEVLDNAQPFLLSDNDLQGVAQRLDSIYSSNRYYPAWHRLDRQAGRIMDMSLRGVRFSVHSRHRGNSHAICEWAGAGRPVQIEEMFAYTHMNSSGVKETRTFCKARPFLPLEDSELVKYKALDQLYRKWGYGGLVGNLDTLPSSCVILKTEDILSHWGKVTLDNGVYAVVPLSQVKSPALVSAIICCSLMNLF
ncbi:hypothetical protein K435DRAFT_682684, partial [Dendrothele bispora CBS 962.96]